ncbi:class I SAM-dependent methyltransferase [Rhodovarius crocodyli]|uniref:Ubiquinone/menaquinone biosynthesis C-methyltransferase UbiE n=2 Tax=Rhodovarius crocodyli TaxID=1979269 RepID=A0A437MJU8_9PROT|nr:class I SAM-dependent methyltransferase [Rhodovarius crocodyli]RVT97947.1 class I SAM-dependent methyltransferase [Rhodovarius crocodyli]
MSDAPFSEKPPAGGTVDFGYTQVATTEKAGMVRAVFDSVAPKYDVMNDLMSLGLHRVWKKAFLNAIAPRPSETLLDLAAGTGDISMAAKKMGAKRVISTDINEAMLTVGRDRALNAGMVLDYMVVDAERIPLPDRSVEKVSIAFGLRNCTDKDAVLAEARRVLRPGGRFFCLEFSKLAVTALEKPYELWSFEVLPRLGQRVAGDADSYQYLAESIRMMPDQETLAGMMRGAGLEQVSYRNLSGGIVAIHSGWRL